MIAEAQTRQFLFLRGGDCAPQGWRSLALPDGWRLHFHPATPVEILDAAPAAPVIRIGQAFNLDAAGETGAGRFALLKWPVLLTDAGALLALHYGARADRQAVSSSPGLAAQALDGRPRPRDGATALEHRSHFNYVPAPGAPFAGLRKLFHDQSLDLARFALRHRPSPIRRLASHDAALTVLAGALCRFAEELPRRVPGKIYLPLTAGLDSRTLAAAFVAAGTPFEAVTLDFCGKWRTDITVARAISRRLGRRHSVIRLAPADAAAVARIAAHTGGTALDWDHTHILPGGGYRYLGAGDAMVSGACFEIGRQRTGETCFQGVDFASATGADIWRRRTGQTAPAEFAALLDDWIAWRRAHPLDMDFAAAFYLDQRIGGWRAALEQGYDLLPGLALSPANDPQIYSALITPNLADQRVGRLQMEVIGLLAPDLLDFSFNPVPLRHRAGRLRRRLFAAVAAKLDGLLQPARLKQVAGE